MLTAYMISAFLISMRLLPIFVISPIVFFARIPALIRIMFTLAISVVLAGWVSADVVHEITVQAIAGELFLGTMIAFGFHAAHAGMDMVGKLLDLQIGLNASGVFDPATSNSIGIISELLTLVFGILFFILDIHHVLLRAIATLLEVLPVGSLKFYQMSPVALASVLGQQFLVAFLMVFPMVLGLWLTDIAFAFMSRSMPQANIYFLALPVKLGVGFLLLILIFPSMIQRMPQLYERALKMDGLPMAVNP